ncbi:hypothetical protein CgunFtcFv8_024530 [Champsocephalus gunnari]|uniref:Uncharacterized protein n=1 Tax=Champsocephalus gunnari TaxID=52237 RepID=A0AAN8DD19_CHAGU|nr:hypothetical protein CgunFtcFv8_024530 [Champsocephalus gunnari]
MTLTWVISCEAWCSSSSDGFLPALCKEVELRLLKSNLTVHQTLSSVTESVLEKHTDQRSRHLVQRCVPQAPDWLCFSTVSLRCLGTAGGSSRGCRRRGTRRRTASCGGALCGHSGDTAGPSADTRCGTQRRSPHT